jgi:hypothetical protein
MTPQSSMAPSRGATPAYENGAIALRPQSPRALP